MKNLFCFLVISFVSVVSHAGPRVIGSGGDVYALQFVAIADKVVTHFEQNPPKGFSVEALKQAVEATTVESTDEKLFLNGIPKDAKNYSETKQIIFSRASWNRIVDEDKPALVLHEYLGILKVEGANYKYSKAILGNFSLFTDIVTGSDSAWYLCSSKNLVVNFFEYRVDYDKRNTRITLVSGGYTFVGDLDDTDSGPVVLTDSNVAGASFIGDVAIDFVKETFQIRGLLNLNAGVFKVDTTLNCQEKSGR
ncbi:hypothetical protein D3C87_1098830 [compost metagenome]